MILTGDIRKAFLQIRIHESERDALRFHWRADAHSEIETYCFTRVLFGLAPSPFLLGEVLEYHLNSWDKKYPEAVERLHRSFYVDDLLTSGKNLQQTQEQKKIAEEIMRDATFELHKWHSNEPQLEDNPPHSSDEERSYAKRQLQVQPNESKLLGVKWNKDEDTIAVQFPTTDSDTSHTATKREVLATLAKVYDPLGLTSPTTLQGKQIYHDVCDVKASWDAPIPDSVKSRWEKWKESLPAEVNTQRPLAPYHEQVNSFELHVFGDASTIGVRAAVYLVVDQKSGVRQSLVTAKARLAKKDLTIPRSELVSAHMTTSLVMNVKNALTELPEPAVYGWLDSTVVLHWILGNGQYHQFVANRVQKIKEHPEVKWRYVPTLDNPANIASRGGLVTNAELWCGGPAWLRDPESWPENPVTKKSQASEKEVKVIKEVLSMAKVVSKKKSRTNSIGFPALMIYDEHYEFKPGYGVSPPREIAKDP